jgi:hypothetical protein
LSHVISVITPLCEQIEHLIDIKKVEFIDIRRLCPLPQNPSRILQSTASVPNAPRQATGLIGDGGI